MVAGSIVGVLCIGLLGCASNGPTSEGTPTPAPPPVEAHPSRVPTEPAEPPAPPTPPEAAEPPEPPEPTEYCDADGWCRPYGVLPFSSVAASG
jgi:hypothetical protein